ncbi:MAG TPA: TrpB-like pyridoxal phosphate-dependent enzyme [Vicinamibacterales bacterium]|nr:TrpB-like pyridoxal phosphate-dependent enzyme [Vicinamibacterales bacterium]HPK72989.1 TrpB-like pyridoxal phosphate-dependent enzyme [Vicinamibacterales bacterium]HPW21255.1 TrpB-like pyridoxal phosphate-dependent enzyme [Vicinamibacterales bacterium]
MTDTKITLPEAEIPTHFYNIAPDLPTPLPPPLHPGTRQPIGPADLAPIFPMALIRQEVSVEPAVEIPDEVREIYRLYRPSPVFRARALEAALDTPAHIYYKSEHVSPVGSHKLNTALVQAWANKQEGVKRLATETGAGQWGSALACACRLMGLECMVYMVRVSYDTKPYRRIMIQSYGGQIVPSPSPLTQAGRAILAEHPDSPGSLGIAISEAVEDAAGRDDTKYSLGSVLNHVILHQTIIGQEAKKQMELAGEYPDILIGCHGGGSNFAGLTFPFLEDKLKGRRPALRAIAVEPASCPTLTKGPREYDFGDTAGLTPLLMMHTLGHNFVPPPVHSGGLRYHGSAPLVSHLLAAGMIEAEAYDQRSVFESAVQFARCEGTIPAPESAHAVHAAMRQALLARESGEAKVILFNLSGHGNFDMAAYDAFLSGQMDGGV